MAVHGWCTGTHIGVAFEGVNFTKHILRGTYVGVDFSECTFDQATLLGSFVSCTFTGCSFVGTDRRPSGWTAVEMVNCSHG